MERHGDPRFYQLLEEIAELHSRKNHDYSKPTEPLSNFRKCEAFGVSAFKGVLVRLSDKWSRIEQLSGGKQAQNESLRDSLIDSAVYSLLAVLLLEDENRPARSSAEILKSPPKPPSLV
jgi:hypothetical protein